MNHEIFMKRCFELAEIARGRVSPNPMVGAVLVHNGIIIGEGYHEYFGGPHAEVNCINAVLQENRSLIAESTLYVSLEPCNHHGKTPPCTDLILNNRIPEVVVACTDPNSLVQGVGIERLRLNGVKVVTNVLQKKAESLNAAFFSFHQKKRPFVLLKWAQTSDGKISDNGTTPLKITNRLTDTMVHRWRSETDAIMIGTNTLLKDNPSLTNRKWYGKNPLRLAIDMDVQSTFQFNIYDDKAPTIIFNSKRSETIANVEFVQISFDGSWVSSILEFLYNRNVQTLLVEGGTSLLQSFIDENIWDECRVITNTKQMAGEGTKAPLLPSDNLINTTYVRNDRIEVYQKQKT